MDDQLDPVATGWLRDEKTDARTPDETTVFGASLSDSFDWEKGFDIEDVLGFKLEPNSQGKSSSCVGQAISKEQAIKEFLETGKWIEHSARSLYALRSNKPNKGASIRDLQRIQQKFGVHKRDIVPDFKTEAEMNVVDFTGEGAKSRLPLRFNFHNSIDRLAARIKKYNGVVIAYDGCDNGTNYKEHPILPTRRKDVQWGHAVIALKAKKIGGEKRIYFLNSWGKNAGDRGWQYFVADDFRTKNSYNPFSWGYVSIDRPNQ